MSEQITTTQDSWLCRKEVSSVFNKRTDRMDNTIHCQLVWGHWFFPKPGDTRYNGPRVIGKSYHELTGPTAEKSIQEYADDLNRRQIPPSEVPDLRPARALRHDPNQLSLALMLKPREVK